jgi:hypothetical protein
MTVEDKIIVGRNEQVDFARYAHNVPAKIDTGADSSSVWVSDVRVDKNGVLRFSLFGEGSPFYTGKTLKRERYGVAMVRSASGHDQIRYKTQLSLRLGGKRIRATFNLSDRSLNKFPVLIGRRTLSGKFIVDVQKIRYSQSARDIQQELNNKLTEDPYTFYKKYYKKSGVSLRRKV